ncbi:MAG: acyl carrier protein [Chitinophagia bacterium]|nr:acyl carrier protein [Chitinophagia bacterium]
MTSQCACFFTLLINQFGVDAQIIEPGVAVADMGLDSLTLMEFIFAAEDAFSLRIPEDKLNPQQANLTLGAICQVIDGMRAA